MCVFHTNFLISQKKKKKETHLKMVGDAVGPEIAGYCATTCSKIKFLESSSMVTVVLLLSQNVLSFLTVYSGSFKRSIQDCLRGIMCCMPS